MEGRRFGFGLAAGLLFGLAIISASGGFGTAYSWVAPLAPAHQSANPSSTTNFGPMTTTVTASQSSSTGSQTNQVVNGNTNSTSPPAQGGAVTTETTASAAKTSPKDLASDLASLQSALTPMSGASRVDSIAQQPLLSDAVVFVPLLMALLIGAAVYVLSRSRREPSGESD